MAFKSGNKELIHFLVKNGADLNIVNQDDMTPICFGSYGLLKEMNLLNGFAILNKDMVQKEMGKRQKRSKSIINMKKNSILLDQKIRKFLKNVERKSEIKTNIQIPIQIISDDEDETPKTANPSNNKKNENKNFNSMNRKSKFYKKPTQRMSVDKNSGMFRSNNINYRLRKGKSIQHNSSRKNIQKKNTEWTKKKSINKNIRTKTVKQKMTFKEIQFNKMMREKKEKQKENKNMDFDNNFIEDTCGSDVFLLQKLPKLYDPKLENDIEFKFRNLDEDMLGKQKAVDSIHKCLQ
jgi:hypothetical protein